MRNCLLALILGSSAAIFGADGPGLTIAVERADGDKWLAADASTVFKPGEEIRFRIRPGFAGYLYVMNETGRGEQMWIYPSEAGPRSNRVAAARDYYLPDGDGAFRIPDTPGYDFVYMILTSVRLPSLPVAPPPPPERAAKNTLLPRCQEGVLRARGVCLDSSAGLRPVKDSKRLENITKMLRNEGNTAAGQIVVHELLIAHK